MELIKVGNLFRRKNNAESMCAWLTCRYVFLAARIAGERERKKGDRRLTHSMIIGRARLDDEDNDNLFYQSWIIIGIRDTSENVGDLK